MNIQLVSLKPVKLNLDKVRQLLLIATKQSFLAIAGYSKPDLKLHAAPNLAYIYQGLHFFGVSRL